MAFSAIIRRVAASAVSTAARATGRARHGHSLGRILPNQTLGSARGILPFVSSSGFSTSIATRPESDNNLLKVIDAEIKCAQECDDHDRVEEIPEGFPFEIQDDKGMTIIRLKGTYYDEKIEVIVSMPSIVTGYKKPDFSWRDDDDGEYYRKPEQSDIPLTVNISKGGSPTLEFSCTAYPDRVRIDALSVREDNKDSDEEMVAYEGPEFGDLLDENIRKSFHRYLKLRGVSPIMSNFLLEYMINKDSRENLLWLKNLKQFFEK